MRKKDARPMDDARRSLNRLSAEPTERRPVRWFSFDDRSPITQLPGGVRERARASKQARKEGRKRERETGHAHPRAAENSERPREEEKEKEEGTGRERISRNNC